MKPPNSIFMSTTPLLPLRSFWILRRHLAVKKNAGPFQLFNCKIRNFCSPSSGSNIVPPQNSNCNLPSATPSVTISTSPPSFANSPSGARAHLPTRIDYSARWKQKNLDLLYYTASIILATFAISYSSVPLYRAICQRTGFGGIPITDSHRFTPDKLIPVTNSRRLRITFNSSVSDMLDWKFVPQQRELRVLPGETALAFYTATNKSKEDIIGVATYSVTPGQVAPYFSKIQCFCFEEQKLNAGETVDMPVFFFIDPEFLEDPQMKGIETITLSYTFFKAKYDDGQIKPLG